MTTQTRIKHFIFFILVFFSFAKITNAGVVINEFVSHPNSGEQEWIELRNTTDSPIDLTGWKLTELSSPGTNPVEKDMLILSGTINTVLVFEVGSTKLNDGGDSIGLYNGDAFVDRVTYGTDSTVKNYSINLNAPTIGKSGALISGDWEVNQDPTKNLSNPNSDNVIDDNQEDGNDSSNTSLGTSNKSSSSNVPLPPLKVTTKIISPKIVVAGIYFSFNSLTTTNRGETYAVGKWIWNFGDGNIKEIEKSVPVEYSYDYPGEYAVTLSYYDNFFDTIPISVDKIVLKVVPAEIFISSVGTKIDPFIEIENKSNIEFILSNWIITAGIHYFKIPEGTILLPNKKIKLSPKITGFTGDDIYFITISDPNNEISVSYPSQTKKILTHTSSSNTIKSKVVQVLDEDSVNKNIILSDSKIINLNDLSANAGKSGVDIPRSAYSIVGLITVLSLGVASFILFRKKDEVNNDISNIRSEDMTIIE